MKYELWKQGRSEFEPRLVLLGFFQRLASPRWWRGADTGHTEAMPTLKAPFTMLVIRDNATLIYK